VYKLFENKLIVFILDNHS